MRHLWKKLRGHVHDYLWDMRSAPVGKRFLRHYQRRQNRRRDHPVKAVLVISLGIFFIILGLVLWITPILPGFFFSVIGLGIIVSRVRFAALWLDQIDLALHRWWRGLRNK